MELRLFFSRWLTIEVKYCMIGERKKAEYNAYDSCPMMELVSVCSEKLDYAHL
jgi:hypothetical protein